MTRDLTLSDGLVVGLWLFGALVVGLLLERLVIRRAVQRVTRTSWGADVVVAGAVHRVVVLWFAVAGAYGARVSLPLRPGTASAVDRSLVAVLIVSATFALSRLAADLLKLYALRNEGILQAGSIFVNVARLLVFVVGLLVLLQTLGVSITPLLTALGVGGLAVALAMQDTLSNLFAGLHILASKKVRQGDYVKLDSGEEGYVIDVNWRNTSLRQLPNNLILVPNARLASAIVTNFNMPEEELSVLVDVGVAYSSDLERVERVATEVASEVAREVPGGVPAFEPFVRFRKFGDSSIDFTVIMRAQAFADQYVIRHEYVKRLQRRFGEEGIEIPFPIRTVHLRGDGSGEANEPGAANGRRRGARSPGRRRG